jgi:hypothetical protein
VSKQRARRELTKLKKFDRAAYDALPRDARKLVDHLRRRFAAELAAAERLPLDQVLPGIIALHEAGFLTLVTNAEGGIGFVPSIDGVPLGDDIGIDFEAAHREVGGRL